MPHLWLKDLRLRAASLDGVDSLPLTHVLKLIDSDSDKASKPDGVDGAEIYLKIVPTGDPAPANPNELTFAGVATTSKVTRTFDAEDAGKTCYYRMRWVNTTGKPGPWGQQVGATIAA